VSIGERVRAGRKALHLSQEEVARRAGVSLNQVNRLERGEIVDPHFSTLAGLATALGMQISELVGEPAVPLGDAPQGSGQAETPKGPEEAPERTPEQRILDEYEAQILARRAALPGELVERLHQDVRSAARIPEVGDAEVRRLADVVGELTGKKVDFGVAEDRAPQESGHSTGDPQFLAVLEDLRDTTERFQNYHEIQQAMDEYREVWERRLAEGEVEKAVVEEVGRAISAFWPAVAAAADAEMAELQRYGSQPEEAVANSVLLPAIARFQALGDKVNSTYREKFRNASASNVSYLFPQRAAS
jgi:transcriptional regulator with XRE-family HTH domain